MAEYEVQIQADFLERQSRAQPVAALAELIWNALDADATRVSVDLVGGPINEVESITVSDDGHGIKHSDAPRLFQNLGGSWKRTRAVTPVLGRQLHGQEGRGRFKALALGQACDWTSTYRKDERLYRFSIGIVATDLRKVEISDEVEVADPCATTGVVAKITGTKDTCSALRKHEALQELAETFAIYLKNYRDVEIHVGEARLDPSDAIQQTWTYELESIASQNAQHTAELEIIEWRYQTQRALYLCNQDGFPLSKVETRFHVGDFQFSAYLKSSYISQLHLDNRLDLAEMVPELASSVEYARKKIKGVFRKRASERAKAVVQSWKKENVYPYEGEAETQLEEAERQIFDIVAVTVEESSSNFVDAPAPQKALHLRMLRSAIERSPTELQRILDEVLRLPKKKQKELATLLDSTDLSGVISAATMVADRLKFLQGLRMILFDFEAKERLRERSQLHKILETNTWIFGEEFNLWASDRELTTVLKQHRKRMDPGLIIDEPVKLVYRSRGVVDLMLARSQRRHRADDFEHLVVELKAPKVPLGTKELTQIKEYAFAVSRDPRYHRVKDVRWHFILISDKYDEFVESEIESGPDRERRLVNSGPNFSVAVKTWGELLEENNARLQFVQEKLAHEVDDGTALEHLRERYGKFLEGVVVREEVDTAPKDGAVKPERGAEAP